VPALVAQAKQASSMKANPVTLSDADLTEILSRAL
jgi:alcohol dehydrogenase class IV